VTIFLQQTANAIAISSVYVFLGVALTIIYGVSRVMDFSQGQVLLLGGFVGYGLKSTGMPFALVVVGSVLAVGVYGYLIHSILLSRARADTLTMFIITLALGLIMATIMVKTIGATPLQTATSLSNTINIHGVLITESRLVIVAVCIPTLILMYVLMHRSRAGRILRATAENRYAAAIVGIDVGKTARRAYVLGCCLSGLMGVLLVAAFPTTPFQGQYLLLKGLAVAIAGGLGNVTGAVIMGTILGLVETYATGYGINIGIYHFDASWQNGYAVVLLIAVLAWRPRGLLRGTVG
jgi:branched-subunit amino acid ABC-type transport system permease component